VTLLESYKIAHGATGHNAGQIVPYFEKPFIEIVEDYGITMANQ
jgi:glycine/D-amino acid oxidase-like deaminating enzyme